MSDTRIYEVRITSDKEMNEIHALVTEENARYNGDLVKSVKLRPPLEEWTIAEVEVYVS